MRFSTCCLALFSMFLLTSNASPLHCKSPAEIAIKEARYFLKETYSLIATALVSKGEAHDHAVEEAKKSLHQADILCDQAMSLLPHIGFTLDSYIDKSVVAHTILKAGVPSWPFLGKALAKTQSIWSSIKNKVKGLFSNGVNEDAGENNLDADTKKKAEILANDINQMLEELDKDIKERETEKGC